VPPTTEKPGPEPVSEVATVPPESPAPAPESEVSPPAEKPSPAPASAAAAAPPEGPVPATQPEVPPPVAEPSPAPTSEATAVQPESPTPTAKPDVPPSAAEPSPAPVSEAAVAPPESPAPVVKPETPPPAAEPSPAPVSEAAVAPPESQVRATEPEVPPTTEKPGPEPASESRVEEPGSPAPAGSVGVPGAAGRRLIPYLWLPGGVEDAATFYVSVFKNSRVVSINRYPESLHTGTWSVQTATVCLDGQDLMLLNAGTANNLPGSFQLLVRCADQAEVDYYWEKLLAGGGEERTGGWLKDRFGVSWQVMPDALLELLNDPQQAARATEAMLKMKKIDIAALRASQP
jgi:predicted 3-demethylubiquinone-9 3-methyltransferase (glyoxalase superfamily)